MRNAQLKTTLAVLALATIAFVPVGAQLLPPNDLGVTMGHVLLNVSNVEAHKKFWMDEFDARPIKVGRLEGITIPGVVLLFCFQPATVPGDGEIIYHLGL